MTVFQIAVEKVLGKVEVKTVIQKSYKILKRLLKRTVYVTKK